MNKKSQPQTKGFTIVELITVIVVIGILATITIVSYTGVTKRAVIVTLQSDLANASDQLNIYQATYGSYPTALDSSTNCPSSPTPDDDLCLKTSPNNHYTYISDGETFNLIEANDNGIAYNLTDDTAVAAFDPWADWLTIGTQTWSKTNLNVGTMVAGAVAQTNNSVLEKYCYGGLEANCTADGGLYQWNEAMQYVTTVGAQGICPTGSHIPTDNDWKILEMQLGLTQAQADAPGYRGTDQSTQLLPGGASGLNIPHAGKILEGSSYETDNFAFLWSSTESDTTAWSRELNQWYRLINRVTAWPDKTAGYSVRCIKN